jgi:hypothetical protein
VLAAGGLCEPVGLPAPAVRVDPQLRVGLRSQALGSFRRLGPDLGQTLLAVAAGGREFAFGCTAGVGEYPVCVCARVAYHRCRRLVGRPDDLGGGRLGARPVEDLCALSLGVGSDRGGLLLRRCERAIGRAGLGIGAASGALERRLGLQPRSLDTARLLGLPGGHGTFAFLQPAALVRERPSGVGARKTTG